MFEKLELDTLNARIQVQLSSQLYRLAHCSCCEICPCNMQSLNIQYVPPRPATTDKAWLGQRPTWY